MLFRHPKIPSTPNIFRYKHSSTISYGFSMNIIIMKLTAFLRANKEINCKSFQALSRGTQEVILIGWRFQPKCWEQAHFQKNQSSLRLTLFNSFSSGKLKLFWIDLHKNCSSWGVLLKLLLWGVFHWTSWCFPFSLYDTDRYPWNNKYLLLIGFF